MHRSSTGFPQRGQIGLVDNTTVTRTTVAWTIAAGLAAVVAARPAAAQAPALDTFRVFLTSGQVLVTHGECAEVEPDLVCVIRLGGGAVAESFDLVTVPLARVDRARTTDYARALRAEQYGATRGARDYADLTADIARMLGELEKATDVDRRIGIAQVARTRLTNWSAEHFGYRAEEIAHLVELLDDVIAELRVAAGEARFSLELLAGLPTARAVPLLGAPTEGERVEAALAAAAVTDVAAERLALLRSAVRVASQSRDVAVGIRTRATAALKAEEAVEARYRALMTDALARADVAVRHGRVSVMQRLIRDVAEQDAAFGSQRPREMAAFTRRLEVELQLAKDQQAAFARWEQVKDQLFAYELRLRSVFNDWVAERRVLARVRDGQSAGPADLDAAIRRFAGIERTLAAMRPPLEMRDIHGVLRSAAQMARQGLLLGQRVSVAANRDIAANASAAIAGADLLLTQARADLVRAMNPRRVRS